MKRKVKKLTEEDLYIVDLNSRFNAIDGHYELEECEDGNETLEHKFLVEYLTWLDIKNNNIWFRCPFNITCKKIMLKRNDPKILDCLDEDGNFYPLRDCDDDIFYKLLDLYEVEN